MDDEPGRAQGLRDVINNPLCAGVWTWSRGGGWEGPNITDEFWCLLNTYVVGSTIYEDKGFKGKPGIGAAVDRYRKVLAEPASPASAKPASAN